MHWLQFGFNEFQCRLFCQKGGRHEGGFCAIGTGQLSHSQRIGSNSHKASRAPVAAFQFAQPGYYFLVSVATRLRGLVKVRGPLSGITGEQVARGHVWRFGGVIQPDSSIPTLCLVFCLVTKYSRWPTLVSQKGVLQIGVSNAWFPLDDHFDKLPEQGLLPKSTLPPTIMKAHRRVLEDYFAFGEAPCPLPSVLARGYVPSVAQWCPFSFFFRGKGSP